MERIFLYIQSFPSSFMSSGSTTTPVFNPATEALSQGEQKDASVSVLCVPEECPTINEALICAKESDGRIKTIRLAKGIHLVRGEKRIGAGISVGINFPIVIAGVGKNETFVQGSGFSVEPGNENSTKDEVVLRDMTVQQTDGAGVDFRKNQWFNEMSKMLLKMIDVEVTECKKSGVSLSGGARAECTNVTLSKCGTGLFVTSGAHAQCSNIVVTGCHAGGVYALSGSITMQGEMTSVTGNVTGGSEYEYGLNVTRDKGDTPSLISLIYPLTAKGISRGNFGGGNIMIPLKKTEEEKGVHGIHVVDENGNVVPQCRCTIV